MKKFYFFSIILSFFIFYLYSSQPPEQGLIFEHAHGKQGQGQGGPTSSGPVHVRKPMIRKTVNPVKQKREDGSYSNVSEIDGLQQFLHLATREDKPLVIKIVSQANHRFIEFQELANQLNDSVIFVSMDASKNHTAVKLLFLILRESGVDLTDRPVKLPIFLLSKKGFVVLQNGSVHFKKDDLKFLNEGDISKEELEVSILQVLKADNGHEVSDISSKKEPGLDNEVRGIPEKGSKTWFYWKKIKEWIKSKF